MLEPTARLTTSAVFDSCPTTKSTSFSINESRCSRNDCGNLSLSGDVSLTLGKLEDDAGRVDAGLAQPSDDPHCSVSSC